MDEERKAEREANLDRKKHARKLWVKTLALARLAAFEKQ